MRPVGTQSRFTTPLSSLFPDPKLLMAVSGLDISHSFGDILTGPSSNQIKSRLVPQHMRPRIHYVERTEGHGPYRSGASKSRIKVKNPNAPAATRATDG